MTCTAMWSVENIERCEMHWMLPTSCLWWPECPQDRNSVVSLLLVPLNLPLQSHLLKLLQYINRMDIYGAQMGLVTQNVYWKAYLCEDIMNVWSLIPARLCNEPRSGRGKMTGVRVEVWKKKEIRCKGGRETLWRCNLAWVLFLHGIEATSKPPPPPPFPALHYTNSLRHA